MNLLTNLVDAKCEIRGDTFIQSDIWNLSPRFINFFENPVTVQFDHRILGMATFILTIALWLYTRIYNLPLSIKKKVNILLLIVIIQFSLGVATLISYVPTHIAITHQLGALIFYSISIWTLKSLPFVSK